MARKLQAPLPPALPACFLLILFVALSGVPCAIPQVLFVFPATPELHGYPLRCKRKKKRKEKTGKEMWVADLSPVCVMYKAARWKRRKEKVDESPRENGQTWKEKRKERERPLDVTGNQ